MLITTGTVTLAPVFDFRLTVETLPVVGEGFFAGFCLARTFGLAIAFAGFRARVFAGFFAAPRVEVFASFFASFTGLPADFVFDADFFTTFAAVRFTGPAAFFAMVRAAAFEALALTCFFSLFCFALEGDFFITNSPRYLDVYSFDTLS
ncbi:MAG: hypothetical protein ACREEM_21885 [Blastocatellia bacterium]